MPALLAAVLWMTVAHAQTGAGTVLSNVATAAFVGGDGAPRTTPSNPVDSVVAGACGLTITPDGTLAAPGHAVLAAPGTTVAFPYLFTSTANLSADFELEALLDPASALAPASIAIHLDLNDDGLLDPGEPAVDELLAVAPSEVVPLLLVIVLAADESVAGDVYVDVVGRCAGAPATEDAGNVALVTVAREGVRAFVKDAAPAPGSALAPGAELTYDLGFTVNEVALVDAVLSDVLDPLLDAPSALARPPRRGAAAGARHVRSGHAHGGRGVRGPAAGYPRRPHRDDDRPAGRPARRRRAEPSRARLRRRRRGQQPDRCTRSSGRAR